MTKRQVITVHGNTAFPIDMLRYDGAWPRSERDSHKILSSLEGTTGYQEIELLSDDMLSPNRDRWLSFGWKVIKVNTVR